MKDVIYKEALSNDNKVKVGILIYVGPEDPVSHLNSAVHNYVRREGYNEYIDANMDNPWVRVIIKGLNEIEPVEFDPQIHHL